MLQEWGAKASTKRAQRTSKLKLFYETRNTRPSSSRCGLFVFYGTSNVSLIENMLDNTAIIISILRLRFHRNDFFSYEPDFGNGGLTFKFKIAGDQCEAPFL